MAQFAVACALAESAVIAAIDDYAAAGDFSPDALSDAGRGCCTRVQPDTAAA
jgi:hypothetical protein